MSKLIAAFTGHVTSVAKGRAYVWLKQDGVHREMNSGLEANLEADKLAVHGIDKGDEFSWSR